MVYKRWTSEVLTSSDFQTYIQDQCVNIFPTQAERNLHQFPTGTIVWVDETKCHYVYKSGGWQPLIPDVPVTPAPLSITANFKGRSFAVSSAASAYPLGVVTDDRRLFTVNTSTLTASKPILLTVAGEALVNGAGPEGVSLHWSDPGTRYVDLVPPLPTNSRIYRFTYTLLLPKIHSVALSITSSNTTPNDVQLSLFLSAKEM